MVYICGRFIHLGILWWKTIVVCVYSLPPARNILY